MPRTWLRQLRARWFGSKSTGQTIRRGASTARLGVETLEDRLAPAQLSVINAADPAALTAGTLRYAVNQANTDAGHGISDTIVFNTAQMGTSTITLQQGQLELKAGSGTTPTTTTISGGNQVTLSGNQANRIFLVDAGAHAVLDGLTLKNGAAASGNGGAIDNAGTLTVSNSTLCNNAATNGGAVYNENGASVTLSADAVVNNSAVTGGGGLRNGSGSMTLSNTTVSGNSAASAGGLLNDGGTLSVTGSTVARNTATANGGINNNGGQLTLLNCIVACNAGGDVTGAVAAASSYNLIATGTGMTGIANGDAQHNLVGTAANPLDPRLTALVNDGGPSPTLALLSGSPALGAGAAVTGITTDQRGLPRTASTDIGAFQTQPAASFAVTAPATVIASVPFSVTVNAKDQNGNAVYNYAGPVTLTSSDGQKVYSTPDTVALLNGTATVPVTLNTAGGVTLKATAGSVTGTTAGISVSPAVASFAVSAPSAATAGTGFNVTITALDAYGNTVAGYNGPVTLTSSDGQTVTVTPASITMTGGTATVSATLKTAGTVTLTAMTGSIQGTSGQVTVSPAAAASFAIAAPGTVGVGTGFAVTLTARDAYGNTVPTYSGAVTWSRSDGQPVAVTPSTLTWSNGTASATVTLNALGTPTLRAGAGSVSGSASVAVESVASQAISAGLTALVSWGGGQSFPLVGTASALKDAIQQGLVNPINAFLAQNPPTSPGFLTLLKNLSKQIGNLSITVDPTKVVQTISGSAVTISLDFQATETVATSIASLGTQADQLGIHLDASTKVNVTTSVHFNLSFGVDASQAFFLKAAAGGLSAQVAINASNINSNLSIGFLGAQVANGSIQMSAQASNAAAINLTLSTLPSLSLTTSGSLNVSLPVQARLGGQSVGGTVSVSQANLADGTAPAAGVQGLGNWQNFSTVSSDAVLGLLNQLSTDLGQLGKQLWTTQLPFLGNLSLAQAAALEQAFQAQVINQISAWSDTLHRTVANFTTAQGLATLLAQVLDMDPGLVNVHFDPATNRLTYHLTFTAYPFANLLPPQMQVDLNKGGLASAGLGSSQLSLVPKITADLTLGVDLTPLGRGFVLTSATTLASLNANAGVRTNGTSAADLQITLTDGSSFTVDLDGASTVQNVIDRIQSASAGKVRVVIDPTSQAGLDVIQVSPAAAGTSATLGIASVNGSHAAEDLGIARANSVAGLGTFTDQSTGGAQDPTGTSQLSTTTITGLPLSGDSLAKHFFIQSTTFTATVDGNASQVNASANLGAVALQMVNGSGTIHVQGSVALQNATTLQQLADALKGVTPLSSLVSSTVAGNAHIELPLQLKVPLPGVTLPTGAKVVVDWSDVTDPSKLSVTVNPALNLGNLTMQPVLQALANLEQFIHDQGAALLSVQIPGLGHSIGDVVNPAAALSAALNAMKQIPPATIDELVSRLNAALGQSATVSYSNGVFQLNLAYGFTKTQNVSLGFNLSPGLGSLADVNGSAPLRLSVNGQVNMNLAIDVSTPATPHVYLLDSSTITVGAMINATGVAFSASVGPLGLFVANGSVRLDNGTAGQAATWTLGLNPSTTNHRWSLDSVAGAVTSTIKAQVNIVLPTFFPTPDQPLDPHVPNIELHVTDLTHPTTTTTTVLPDFTQALSGINLTGIMSQVVNGWDGVMRMLQTALTKQINAAKIPLVGPQLQKALDFLRQMDEQVTTLLKNAPQLAATAVQDALYKALGPQGLNWLVNLVPGGAATESNFVQLQQSNGSIHYLLKLHEDLGKFNTAVAANLGLDGLGLKVNGNVALNAGFDATLGFGLSQNNGFYLDQSDTAQVGFTALLPDSLTASLAFLQFNVSRDPLSSGPQLQGGLTLNLNDVHGTGRLSLADLASTSAYTIGLDADACVRLKMDATIAGNTNLPHLTTGFYLTWNYDPTNPNAIKFDQANHIDPANSDTLGFSDVKLDLGGFIDNIAKQIGSILAPIKPLADVLSAPLPVLSQLAGHKVDLVDLASALGFCSPSTAQFINDVATFVSGDALSVPSGIDLGSFTLDPTAAADPASLGNLNPATSSPNSTSASIGDTQTGNAVSGFKIPILDNPANAFQLLLGKDVSLVTYETPALDLNFAFSQFFPIIGPLGANLMGQIGAKAQFGFGFDTRGFREFAADNFRDPSLILDGFYVSNRANPDGTGPVVPQVQLYGSIAAYAALDLGIFQAGVGGGLFASINFNVHDPSGTGKVHLQDLIADVKKGTIFDASGALKAFLDAYVEIDLGFFSKRWDFQIANVTLAQIGQKAQTPDTTPQLGSVQNGVLRLNVGAYAPQRLYNTATDSSKPSDGNESLSVTSVPGKPNSVYVSGYGVTNQEYDGVTKIVADGAAGGDNITVDVGSNIDVDLATGKGTNTFVVKNAGNVTLTGGAGNDTLEVDHATSAQLIGGSGTEVLKADNVPSAVLRAGSGTNTLYGGSGAGQLLFGGDGTNLLVAGSGDNQVLHGGNGTSTLVGGSGTGQQLFADDGTANLFGGTGSKQLLAAGTDPAHLTTGMGNDHLVAGEADGQVLWGGKGTDVLQVGWHVPDTTQPISFGNMPVGATDGAGNPLQVGWHLHEDLLAAGWTVTNYTPGNANQGAGHAYEMHAGNGDTLIIGGFGDVTIYGGSGDNTLYGGGGNGNKTLIAGTGATEMYGGGPGNSVGPSTGKHILYGGSGKDVMYGGDGVNIVVNAVGTGLINPAGDSGDNGVNILVAGTGDSTLYADSTGDHENVLIAGSGRDKLFAGGTSGDYLEAGSGIASLYGGTGNDIFQLPFIPAGQQATTPDVMVGGLGMTTLVLSPLQTALVNGQPVQQSLSTNSDIYLNKVAGTADQYLATLRNLGDGTLVGQVQFTLPGSVQRVALIGGNGDNKIQVDPGIYRATILYGGPGHNTLMAGSGDDTLVGGPGGSVLYGGSGDDVLYGGAMPAQLQRLLNTVGAPPAAPQAPGHNVLIAGPGNSQLYAGNGGDLLIGGGVLRSSKNGVPGEAILDANGNYQLDAGTAGRDVLTGGDGNDFMIATPGSTGVAMFAGKGDDFLVGGNGENILQGGAGTDLLFGGGLINVMMSGSAAGGKNTLVGGSGLNFEFAGAGTDALYDYADAASWASAVQAAGTFHLALSAQQYQSSQGAVNPVQAYQGLEEEKSALLSQVGPLNAVFLHPYQTGNLSAGSNTVSGLYFTQQTGTIIGGSNAVTGLSDTTQFFDGEIVTGPGIPDGTTLTIARDSKGSPLPGMIYLSNVVNLPLNTSSKVTLSFSDPLVVAPTWELGNTTKGSTTATGLVAPMGLTGTLTRGSATVAQLASTRHLMVGDTVTGSGIAAGTTIAQILDDNSLVLSGPATAGGSLVALSFSVPLQVGQAVSGPGIPAGTTIASIVSGTSITLSNAATATGSNGTLCFGSSLFTGPTVVSVTGPGGTATGLLPAGTSVSSILTGTSVALSENATATAGNVTLQFQLTAEEEAMREHLNNELQAIAQMEVADLGEVGATSVMDYLQGGSGTTSLYAGARPAWMIGGPSSTGTHTFYITPANDPYFATEVKAGSIQGGPNGKDALVFLGDDKNITINTPDNAITDVVGINGTTLSWTEGRNIGTLGVQTMGGADTVTVTGPKFGEIISVVDGGTAAAHGDVTIDATGLTSTAILQGGAGNDTIKISQLAFGSWVQGGTGTNELDILCANSGADIEEGIDPATGQQSIEVGAWLRGTWAANGSNFQKLVVTGGSGSNTMYTNGKIPIANTILEGGSGTNVIKAYGGNNTLIGGSGTNAMTASGGTSTLVGGAGSNTFYLQGAGTYNVFGGTGSNVVNGSGGTETMLGGTGPNVFNLSGPGTYVAVGGSGPNTFTLNGAANVTVTGGAGANTLNVQAANSFDTVTLSQSGSTITVTDATSSGTAVTSAKATGMNTVNAFASAGGHNTLSARGMTMGVNLIGQALGTDLKQGTSANNTLIGGAGNDVLNGGQNFTANFNLNDALIANNNGDVLVVSGNNSSYQGTGSNALVYAAQPNLDVIVYGKGLLITPPSLYSNPMSWSGDNRNFASGTVYVPFSGISGIGAVKVADSTGTVATRAAGTNDLPGSKIYVDQGSYYVNGWVTWNGERWGNGTFGDNNFAFYVQPGQTITMYPYFVGPQGWQEIDLYDAANWGRVATSAGNGQVIQWTNNTGGVKQMFFAFFHYWIFQGWSWSDNPTATFAFNGLSNDVAVNWAWNGMSSSAAIYFGWVPHVVWAGGVNTWNAQNTYGLWSGNPVLTPALAPVPGTIAAAQGGTVSPPSGTTVQAVAGADQFNASLGQFVDQVAAGSTFAGSSVPVIQQLSALGALAQKDAAALQTSYSDFDKGVTTFLNNVLASGQAQSAFVQQQVVALNAYAANGTTNSPAAQGLLWFLNHVYFGGLTAAPFAGTTVTSAQVMSDGGVWFTCANGALGYAANGQPALAVTLNNVAVQIASLVIGPDATAWFVTTGGQIAYCRPAQSAAVLDPLAKLVLKAPGSSTAGNTVTLSVTAQDAAGNTILDYPGTVQFSSSDQQAGLPANYTFTPADLGSHTFNVVLKTAGTQTVTLTAGSVSAQATVQVTAAAAARFVVATTGTTPASTTAGVAVAVTVTAKDAYGNTVPNYAGTVQFSSGDGQAGLPASYPFVAGDQGSHTFNVVLKTAGAQTVTATAGSVTGQTTVQVTAAAATGFAVSAPSAATAGVGFKVTITAQDAYGNTVPSYSGPATLASSDGQTVILPSGGITLTGGTATVTVTLDRAGSVKLTATAGALKGTSGSISVGAAAAAKVAFISAPPSSVKNNTAFGATVQVQDQFGNNVSGVAVSIQQSGGNLTGGGSVTTNSAGQATFSSLDETQVGTFDMHATAAGLSSATVETSVTC
jgi:Ca2+-binding RTX toxin-like protein